MPDAKSQGLVGETPTGYLEVVKANPETDKLINAKRKTHYQKIAKKNKTPLSKVEEMAGKKAMKKTPAGQYVKVGGGSGRRSEGGRVAENVAYLSLVTRHFL